jgi:hypothetical protein
MIELPEALTIAGQMAEALAEKRIAQGVSPLSDGFTWDSARGVFAALPEGDLRALYEATRQVPGQMAALGGRDSEYDLFNQPGRYRRLLHSKTVGQPCPQCGAPIEKIAFLGGACYYCPECQKV